MVRETEVIKAEERYAKARANPGGLIAVLRAAREFVANHTESWYYSGNELLGRIDGKIEELESANGRR